jgi:transketolase
MAHKADKELKKRLLKLLYDHNEEHVGSCFTCIDMIDGIYKKMDKDDVFILSNGHAAYALYVILEKYYDHVDADNLVEKHGGHPNLDLENHIDCSTGSLGLGIAVAVGRAAANPDKKVYVTITDGECAEGIVWESLRYIKVAGLKNIEVHVNANGWACYDPIDVDYLEQRCKAFLPDIVFHRTEVEQFPFLVGLDAHYMKLTEEDYKLGLEILENEC